MGEMLANKIRNLYDVNEIDVVVPVSCWQN